MVGVTRPGAILTPLGERKSVPNLFAQQSEPVKKWYGRGIPYRHWHRIIALNPELTPEYLDRTKPRFVQRRNGKQARR